MAIVRQTMVYDGPGGPFEGVLAYDDEVETARPAVMIVPNILGQKEFDNVVAEKVAALGYVGFACDVYGQGKRTTRESPEPGLYMNQVGSDRALLRDRLGRVAGGAQRLRLHRPCEGRGIWLLLWRQMRSRHGAVGSGHPRRGVLPRRLRPTRLRQCHADQAASCWSATAGTIRSAHRTRCVALGKELTEGGCDWQIHAYGHTGHAFTDAGLKGQAPGPGFGYSRIGRPPQLAGSDEFPRRTVRLERVRGHETVVDTRRIAAEHGTVDEPGILVQPVGRVEIRRRAGLEAQPAVAAIARDQHDVIEQRAR